MTSTGRNHFTALAWIPALKLAFIFAAIKLGLQFALTLWTEHLGYGYVRDEFYYIACGRHLAWGYVDHGPMVAVQARLGEILFGDSVFALRILSALAGAVAVLLTGVITWALGGGASSAGSGHVRPHRLPSVHRFRWLSFDELLRSRSSG